MKVECKGCGKSISLTREQQDAVRKAVENNPKDGPVIADVICPNCGKRIDLTMHT